MSAGDQESAAGGSTQDETIRLATVRRPLFGTYNQTTTAYVPTGDGGAFVEELDYYRQLAESWGSEHGIES